MKLESLFTERGNGTFYNRKMLIAVTERCFESSIAWKGFSWVGAHQRVSPIAIGLSTVWD